MIIGLGKDKKSLILNQTSLLSRISIMANIIIPDLRPAGSDLFSDSESYLMNLNEDELDITRGGLLVFPIFNTTVILTFNRMSKR